MVAITKVNGGMICLKGMVNIQMEIWIGNIKGNGKLVKKMERERRSFLMAPCIEVAFRTI